jgi:hypothetical protein
MSVRSKIQSPRRNPRVRAADPEPSVNELLDDPVLQILMSRDGVGRDELLEIIDAARLRLGVADEASAVLFERTLFAECRA